MLPLPLSLQRLQPITGRTAQVLKIGRLIDYRQLSPNDIVHIYRSALEAKAGKDRRGPLVGKAHPDPCNYIFHRV
jgi:hypothetical protein